MQIQTLGYSKQERKRFSLLKRKYEEKGLPVQQRKDEFEKELERISQLNRPVVYQCYKLTHQGIINFKRYENCNRKIKDSSLRNLLNYSADVNNNDVNGQPFDSSFGFAPITFKEYRKMDGKQKRDCRKMANKLTYYSKKREFKSSKSGKYQFKVGFLTLTAPDTATNGQILTAFEHFLDYLRRTVCATYVWKKEIGSKGGLLHFHILLNNVIPYYIVDWKWKRLLMNEGVIWPTNEKGEHTKSHYKIELPRNAKGTSSYISKYLAKDEYLPVELGYIWGCSESLKKLKEITLIEGEISNDELWNIIKKSKTVSTDFVNVTCCDLMKVARLAPNIFKVFEKQFYEFQSKITHAQRFQSV